MQEREARVEHGKHFARKYIFNMLQSTKLKRSFYTRHTGNLNVPNISALVKNSLVLGSYE